MSDDELHDDDPTAALADELLRLGASLTLIIDHMARTAGGAPPGAEPVDVVLARLLREVLADELHAEPASAVAATTAMLGRACDAIGRDLFIADLWPRS